MPENDIRRSRKASHGNFVGGIQSNAVRSSFFSSFKSQPQAGESLEVRLLEFQVP